MEQPAGSNEDEGGQPAHLGFKGVNGAPGSGTGF